MTNQPLGLVIHSYWIRAKQPQAPKFPPINDPIAFMDEAQRIGAAGIQVSIPANADHRAIRASADSRGLYLEGIVGLPKTALDVERFEDELKSASRAGAEIVRTVCMSGRRYEVFDSREQFDRFARDSWEALQRAELVAARQRVTLAVENHKDWRTDEMVDWLKRLSSEWVRVCLDTGNSIALLEDPMAVIESLAPYTASTHIKDMAVAECNEGFQLSEIPFGDGFLDLPKVVSTLRIANPRVHLNLEMITRDPLLIPCLAEKYWATLPDFRAQELAQCLARVHQFRANRALPIVSKLSPPDQLAVEAANIQHCLEYASKNLK